MARGPDQAQQQGQRPGAEEAGQFGIGAAWHLQWQQPVGQQIGRDRQRQTAHEADIETCHQPFAKGQGGGRCLAQGLGAALDRPQYQARGNHQRTHDAKAKQHPAHPDVGETPQMQAIEHAIGFDGWALWIDLGLQLAGAAIETQPRWSVLQPVAVVAGDLHQRALAVAAHGDAADTTAPPQLTGLAQHGAQIQHGQGFGLCVAATPGAARTGNIALQLGEIALRIRSFCARVGGGYAGRHIHGVKNHQTAERNHQIERQHQYPRDVVCVQPGALSALARAKGEEVLEDAAMRDHAGQQGNEHHQRRRAHHPAALDRPAALVSGAKLEMEAVEKFSASGLSGLQCGPGLRVQQQSLEAAVGLVAPQYIDGRRTFIGQTHDEVADARRVLVQRRLGALRNVAVG